MMDYGKYIRDAYRKLVDNLECENLELRAEIVTLHGRSVGLKDESRSTDKEIKKHKDIIGQLQITIEKLQDGTANDSYKWTNPLPKREEDKYDDGEKDTVWKVDPNTPKEKVMFNGSEPVEEKWRVATKDDIGKDARFRDIDDEEDEDWYVSILTAVNCRKEIVYCDSGNCYWDECEVRDEQA